MQVRLCMKVEFSGENLKIFLRLFRSQSRLLSPSEERRARDKGEEILEESRRYSVDAIHEPTIWTFHVSLGRL
jgi:hypothetical protein